MLYNLCYPLTFYLLHEESVNIISSRGKKSQQHYCGVLFNDNQRKRNSEILNPSSITNEKTGHLDISFPNIIISFHCLANFITSKAILNGEILYLLVIFHQAQIMIFQYILATQNDKFSTAWWNHPGQSLSIACRTDLIPSAQML